MYFIFVKIVIFFFTSNFLSFLYNKLKIQA